MPLFDQVTIQTPHPIAWPPYAWLISGPRATTPIYLFLFVEKLKNFPNPFLQINFRVLVFK